MTYPFLGSDLSFFVFFVFRSFVSHLGAGRISFNSFSIMVGSTDDHFSSRLKILADTGNRPAAVKGQAAQRNDYSE